MEVIKFDTARFDNNVVLTMSQFLGDVFSQSDTAKTMAEISRIDPQFNKDSFLKECEFEIIPSVLEVRYSNLGATEFMHRPTL